MSDDTARQQAMREIQNRVIRYTSRGTTNGKPVGEVYVQDVSTAIPTYPRRYAFSYTKDPAEATHFTATEAERLKRKWAGSVVETLNEARRLA